MAEPRDRPAPIPRHRRRRIGISILLAVVLVGGVVAVVKSNWWECHTGTRSGGDAHDFVPASEARSARLDAIVDRIDQVPGVGPLLGSVALQDSVTPVAVPGGGIILTDRARSSDLNASFDTRIDPLTGTKPWSRGHAGKASKLLVAGDTLLSFAAVSPGHYRLSVLDAENGSIRGCTDIEDVSLGTLGRASAGVSHDGEVAVVAAPMDDAVSAVSAYSVGDGQTLWDTEARGGGGPISFRGDTVVLDTIEAADVYISPEEAIEPPSPDDGSWVTGLDAATGKVAWTWPSAPAEETGTSVGATVPFDGDQDDIVAIWAAHHDGERRSSRLVGLDPSTGGDVWMTELPGAPRSVRGFGSTILAHVYAGDSLIAFDAETGQELWTTPAAILPRLDTAQRWGDDIIIGKVSGIVVVDLATGKLTNTPLKGALDTHVTVSDSVLAVMIDGPSEKRVLFFAREA